MTFSIVGYDPRNGDLGVAVASRFLAIGALVPWARAGVGAVATQSAANTRYGPQGIDMLAQGIAPEEVVRRLIAEDTTPTGKRQFGLIDAQGRAATYTGPETHGWAGGIVGPNFAAQGNILVSREVIDAMAEIFTKKQAKGDGELADHLVAALLAGQAAGGDSRGQQAAALLVVRANGGYGRFNDRYVDLRVDEHPYPSRELRRLLDLHQLYFQPTNPARLVPIQGSTLREVRQILLSTGYLRQSEPGDEFDDDIRKALVEFCERENLEDRLQTEAVIDPVVLRYMRRYGEHAVHVSLHGEEGAEPTHLHIQRPGQSEHNHAHDHDHAQQEPV